MWSPASASLTECIESIQRKFVMYASRRLAPRNSDFRLPPYDDRRKVLGLDRLSDRRAFFRVVFMYDVLKRRVSAPDLCEKFELHLNVAAHPYDLQTVRLFRPHLHRTDYGLNEPITAICDFEDYVNIYETSHTRQGFRFRVKSLMELGHRF